MLPHRTVERPGGETDHCGIPLGMPGGPILLIIPPLTQLNTPYPSTAYLTGFLRSRGYLVEQADLGIEMVLALFTRTALARVFKQLHRKEQALPGEARQMLALERAYLDSIDPVIAFLQGQDPMMAARLCRRGFLPQGPRFAAQASHIALLQSAPSTDHARRLATLYLEDLTDLIHDTIAPHFGLSRYAEQVATSSSSFDQILQALEAPPCLTDTLLESCLWRHIEAVHPILIGLTVPFPGNLYGAFRIAQAVKSRRLSITVVLGGGYVNTQLRRLRDPRVFDYVDYMTLDDGERPFLCLLEHLEGKRDEAGLCRMFVRAQDTVLYRHGAAEPAIGMAEGGTPTYDGLPLDRYLSILDTLNPMHRLWSEGHWNKFTVAHGCYWKQCTFCDVGLDYIARYESTPTEILADRVEALIAETGRRGFHFVDEAAAPAGLKALALTLLERGVAISWWGNIRFEEAFTPDLCRLLAASGCVAITAGLEAASDRLLAEMKKGITVAQTAQVAAAFRKAGVLVHAYLMYGCPGETIEETVASLERVRQLFATGLLQSAFWHRFTATAHSPIGLNPKAHGIRITGPPFQGFTENDLCHVDPAGATPAWVGDGLRTALHNYMEGNGLTVDVRRWFAKPVKRPHVPAAWLKQTLATSRRRDDPTAERRLVWIGGKPVVSHRSKQCRIILPNNTEDATLILSPERAAWLMELIEAATPAREHHGETYPSLKQVREAYPFGGAVGFDRWWDSSSWKTARRIGLLVI